MELEWTYQSTLLDWKANRQTSWKAQKWMDKLTTMDLLSDVKWKRMPLEAEEEHWKIAHSSDRHTQNPTQQLSINH